MRSMLLPAVLVFALAIPVFSHFIHLGDNLWHIQLAMEMGRRESFQPHPLFHACLIALTARGDTLTAPGVVAILLAAALGLRAWLTASELTESSRVSPFTSTVLCLGLALAMPLPSWWGEKTYLGDLSPNSWHNPTGIFAMPLALAVFLTGMRLVSRPTMRAAAVTSFVILLSLLAKPSYMLAFGPCLLVSLLAAIGRAFRQDQLSPASALGIVVLTFGPAAILLTAQYALFTHEVRVMYAPFEVWRRFTRDHMLGSVLVGIAFPLAVVACYPREANASQALTCAWATLAVGVATYALFAESGVRMTHGNFRWGMIYADHILFVASSVFLFRQRGTLRRSLCLGVLGLHVISGVRYLAGDWTS